MVTRKLGVDLALAPIRISTLFPEKLQTWPVAAKAAREAPSEVPKHMRRSAIITTKRLRLRNWLARDVAGYRKHCNTAAVMEYLGGVMPPRSVRAEVLWYQWHQAKYGFTFWVLERKRDNALLGFCGIILVPEAESPLLGELEIGWRLRADMWRRGYAYEAAAAVVEWAEWERPGEVLFARIHKHNEASQALARKLGMHRARALEAKQRQDDRELFVFKLRL